MDENLPDTSVGNIEYISKQDVINCIEHMTWYHVNGRGQLVDGANSDTGLYKAKDVYKGLHDIPPADVAPVVHSRWIKTEDGAECENCGREAVYQIVDDHWEYEPWCPHCGAKMDGGDEHG